MGNGGLVPGAKVAVVGGGVAGSALALALTQIARSRDSTLEVCVFEGARTIAGAPVLLSPECRARMAGLGCRVERAWRAAEIESVEVIHGDRVQRFQPARSGLWVIDEWPGTPGKRLLSQAFLQSAVKLGARVLPRRVDRVETAPESRLVVRAQGMSSRFDAVAIASGVGRSSAANFLSGYEPPPTTSLAHARVGYPPFRGPRNQAFRVILSPLDGVDALFLLPARGSIFAWVVGAEASPSDLCQALMGAARDGHLQEGFEITELVAGRAAVGTSKTLIARDQIVAGTAALGSPLQLGISDALATATRAAAALFETGQDARALRAHYVERGVKSLSEQASAGGRALRWLVRAGPRGPQAMAKAAAQRYPGFLFSSGVLGLTGPSPRTLLSHARWSSVRQFFTASLQSVIDPLPASAIFAEPNLYYIVDDDPSAREAVSRLLEPYGRVVAFADELALYSAVARRPPACILLDVVLNWVDGITLCAGLKQHPLTRDVPVFVITGLDRPHIRHRALAAGANAFFTKPIDAPLLLQCLNLHRTVATQAISLDARRPAPRPITGTFPATHH